MLEKGECGREERFITGLVFKVPYNLHSGVGYSGGYYSRRRGIETDTGAVK